MLRYAGVCIFLFLDQKGGKGMKRFVIFIVLMGTVVLAWNGHDSLTYLIVTSTLSNAQEMVEITPYNYVEKRVYNTEKMILEDYCGQFEKQHPFAWKGAILPPDPEPVDGRVPVWQILTIYSFEPDLGMDEGLDLSPLQGIIGGSQGVRHMKYNILMFEFFEGSQSFYYFVDMSRKAFENGDRYWGYRFLARAIHYLEDLSQPYHNTPGSLSEILQVAFDSSVAEMLFNAHYSYDEYLAYLLYNEDKETIAAVTEAEPRFVRNNRELIQRVRLIGLNHFGAVHNELKRLFQTTLMNRQLTHEDFALREDDTSLLKTYTVEIVSQFSSLLKGFLLSFLKQVGEI